MDESVAVSVNADKLLLTKNIKRKKAYDEREVSSVLFGSLEKGQELCGDGDIAGHKGEMMQFNKKG